MEQVLGDKEQEQVQLGEACPPCHHDCRWSHLWRPVHGSLTGQSTGRGQTQGKETEIKFFIRSIILNDYHTGIYLVGVV